MLRRKAYDALVRWKREKTTQGLLVEGARQVGKTTIVRAFAADHYASLVEVNFFQNADAIEMVNGANDADDLFLRLSVLGRQELVPGRTLVFLDEIQECGDLLTWLKFLIERHDIDFILSGSRLGLDSFDARSLPVGYLRTLEMFPLDFEEFCWANGYGRDPMDVLRSASRDRTPVPGYLHDRMISLFYTYLLVGGMPDAVQTFCDQHDLPRVRGVQNDIVKLYGHDIAKYVSDKVEARQIRMIYDAMPAQLDRPNKRFAFTRLGKNLRFANLETAFDWLCAAGVALPAYRVHEPLFPLVASEDRSSFKLYLNDVGLLTARLMGDVDLQILNRRSSINFGSIFENAVAQELRAHGLPLDYFNTRRVGEVDFMLQTRQGDIVPVEVKSGKDYRRHSALNNLLATENYGIDDAVVLYDGNVEREGPITYLPVYLVGFITEAQRFLSDA